MLAIMPLLTHITGTLSSTNTVTQPLFLYNRTAYTPSLVGAQPQATHKLVSNTSTSYHCNSCSTHLLYSFVMRTRWRVWEWCASTASDDSSL